VVPLDRREFFGTKISRMMEKLVMHKIRRQQAKK
jgi:predicted HAD superfamily phosphohydrolase YqeG